MYYGIQLKPSQACDIGNVFSVLLYLLLGVALLLATPSSGADIPVPLMMD
jgi:hypothetical protein